MFIFEVELIKYLESPFDLIACKSEVVSASDSCHLLEPIYVGKYMKNGKTGIAPVCLYHCFQSTSK